MIIVICMLILGFLEVSCRLDFEEEECRLIKGSEANDIKKYQLQDPASHSYMLENVP